MLNNEPIILIKSDLFEELGLKSSLHTWSKTMERHFSLLIYVQKIMAAITDKVSEMFSYEIAYYSKSSTSIFKESFASIDKILFLGQRLGTRL